MSRGTKGKWSEIEVNTYRDINHKIPHYLQPPWREMIDTFEPFQDRPSHEKGLREPEDVFMIEDSRSLSVNLFVDAQQRGICGEELQLNRVSLGADKGMAVNQIADFAGQ